MRNVAETDLPGAGVRFDLQATRAAPSVWSCTSRGRRDLAAYDDRDVDRAVESVVLSEDEGHTLGHTLGGSPVPAEARWEPNRISLQ